MCQTCHNPVLCFITPDILENIKLRGSKRQKERVDQLISQSTQYRELRQMRIPKSAFTASAVAPRRLRKPRKNRKIYDAEFDTNLPGKLVRKERGRRTEDIDADTAYTHAGIVFDFFWDAFKRDSIDDNGMEMVSTVHYGEDYNNAFWNGNQMTYGDGDGMIFKSFAGDLSIAAHEQTHGVVQFSGGLSYNDQPGALNESISDVLAALIVQYEKKQEAHEASWLIGDHVLGNSVSGKAIRSMKAPGTAYSDALIGKDPQPYHMDGYVNTNRDNGGVHINSGIPNHAFYLLATFLGGHAWKKAGQIWYHALQNLNNSLATFEQWAAQTVAEARSLYGGDSDELIYTSRAWNLVGINVM